MSCTAKASPPPSPLPRPTRTKSKTGCKTCKVRRVRCGEERPACRRCTSTGRICDGYGIWGGGSADKRSSQPRCRPPRQPPPQRPEDAASTAEGSTTSALGYPRSLPAHPAGTLSPDERYHFDWFWRRTARKIPGAFFSDAGNALFFQACASDAAVTHGVLAMCSAHRSADPAVLGGGGRVGVGSGIRAGGEDGVTKRPPTALLRREEVFALRQYNKAIWHLRPHLQTNDTTSLRIALYSCLAFIWVEYFRSRYQSAASHLEHGLRMLQYARGLAESKRFGGEAIDHWVVGVFRKLYMHATLFGQRPRHAWPFPDSLKPISNVSVFLDPHEARNYLEQILLKICDVMETRSNYLSLPSGEADALEHCIKEIMIDLDAWLSAYDKTVAMLEARLDKMEAFACRLLRMYHAMAVIMADTACECDELKYDRHTSNFRSIIQQALEMRKVALDCTIRQKYFGSEDGLPHSIGDMGPVTPLYYVALHCRVHRLKVHAIRLIEEEPHKEGIYDAALVTNIARKVMAVEEGDSRRQDPSEDDFPLGELPGEAELLLAQVPTEERRVQVLEVLLPDDPWGFTVVRCRRQHAIERFKITAQLSTGKDDMRVA
ncbi:hypothetical protein PV04_03384 [Phialophora macrospora]|uniref:Zn(2)-C6 fungal-type domain-containing protein n=1 Tax=Phialophora macrospora TaxID=1851006 RepID=A0A0D2FS59_9EURO|nr:hypothetical protein PV04_03384 [Phialophora macrospora]